MPLLRSCAFTGYRPEKYSFPLEGESPEACRFQTSLAMAVNDLIDKGVHTFLNGGARGFDILAAEAVLAASEFRPVDLITVLPFPAMDATWSLEWMRRYETVLQKSREVITLSPAYHAGAYAARNRYMVDHSDCVMTWFDGKKGGTANTLAYAEKTGRIIINLADEHPLSPRAAESDQYPLFIVGQLPFCD